MEASATAFSDRSHCKRTRLENPAHPGQEALTCRLTGSVDGRLHIRSAERLGDVIFDAGHLRIQRNICVSYFSGHNPLLKCRNPADKTGLRYDWCMNRIQKMAVVVTIAAMIGLTGCSSTTELAPADTSEVSLAETVWSQVEENFPDGITSGSPLFVVTDVEDVSSGIIRVDVQDNLTDDGREEIARHMFNMGALQNDELTTVVVRDLSGRDSNHNR